MNSFLPPVEERRERGRFLRSAAILSLGGILAKGIGVIYRVPLAGALGAYGMGLYQMAYPLFCLLLTFSSSGIPTAFSRLVARERARGRETRSLFDSARRTFALLGLAGTALMCLLAPEMSRLQGDGGLLPCYFCLAPSVFLVALIAVYRGYFQGENDMLPTAASELVEQLIKTAFGLFFAFRSRGEPVRAVAGCLLAVTLSEGAALLFLMARRGIERGTTLRSRPVKGGEVLFSALPVMAATGLLPLSQTADSVLVVRLLARFTPRAVSLYGLYAGAALSLVSLPATLCYGAAAASVPAVSRAFARGEEEEGRYRAMRALLFTLALSLPCAAGLFCFSPAIVSLLYPSLSPTDARSLVSLLRLLSASAAVLPGVDTLAACLAGMGRAKSAARAMLFAVLVKFALQWVLITPALSVGGAAIAANACYLVAFFSDLVYTGKKQKKERAHDHGHRSRNRARRSHAAGKGRSQRSGRSACADRGDVGADA